MRGAGIAAGTAVRIKFMATDESTHDDQQSAASAKKPYEKPSFRFEQVFVTTALRCGKVGGEAQCTLNLKVS
jgi:hypothetical protein